MNPSLQKMLSGALLGATRAAKSELELAAEVATDRIKRGLEKTKKTAKVIDRFASSAEADLDELKGIVFEILR